MKKQENVRLKTGKKLEIEVKTEKISRKERILMNFMGKSSEKSIKIWKTMGCCVIL